MRIAVIISILLCLCLFISPAHAQVEGFGSNPNSDLPLEITADQTLEWHRNNQQYIARGNVVAKQGDVSIYADTLTADYRETAASAFEIYRLTADGNVRIVSQGNTATGERATYDVDRSVAIMTGNNLSLTSPDQSVTARDSFEYWVADGRLNALGNAHVVRGEDKLDADQVSAIFADDAAGNRRIKSLGAEGNVRITTPEEVLTGSRGEYNAATNIAALIGNVKITRGPNVLSGERAEVNLATNVSKMVGSPSSGGRVRGVFYPGSTDGSNPITREKAVIRPAPAPTERQPQLLGQ